MTDRVPTIEQIGQNPTLHPLALELVKARFPDIKWHSHADSPDSSQSFALSAFLPLLTFEDRDAILERFVTTYLPAVRPRVDRRWDLVPEFTRPELLGETGAGVPTNVDVLLLADDAVVCVESKFRVDAREGFGKCGQFNSRACHGFHGSGSDAKGGGSPCRLAVPDGRRAARLYWELGRGHFRDQVFQEQEPSSVCPFRDTYQLMRNYLVAAAFAAETGRRYYGVIGLVPKARRTAIASGMARFRDEVLQPQFASLVAAVDYEAYQDVLNGSSAEARELAGFLADLLD